MEQTKKTITRSYDMDVCRYTPDELSFFYENAKGYSGVYAVDGDDWKPSDSEKIPPKNICIMFGIDCKDAAAGEEIITQLKAAKKIELGYDGEDYDDGQSNVREILYVDNVDWTGRLIQMA
jgi:hypothetical protein